LLLTSRPSAIRSIRRILPLSTALARTFARLRSLALRLGEWIVTRGRTLSRGGSTGGSTGACGGAGGSGSGCGATYRSGTTQYGLAPVLPAASNASTQYV
jgi:hypothetical protein